MAKMPKNKFNLIPILRLFIHFIILMVLKYALKTPNLPPKSFAMAVLRGIFVEKQSNLREIRVQGYLCLMSSNPRSA